MYAVIKTGGKQYRVVAGEKIENRTDTCRRWRANTLTRSSINGRRR